MRERETEAAISDNDQVESGCEGNNMSKTIREKTQRGKREKAKKVLRDEKKGKRVQNPSVIQPLHTVGRAATG